MQLAAHLGITDYPSPAGGCFLTDPVLSLRIEKYYKSRKRIIPEDILLMMVGRQLKLPTGGWLVVGRNEKENSKIEELRQPGDWLLTPKDIPGPSAILRYGTGQEKLAAAASVMVRYVKKSAMTSGSAVIIAEHNGTELEINARPFDDMMVRSMLKS
jgi:hypothetical protein